MCDWKNQRIGEPGDLEIWDLKIWGLGYLDLGFIGVEDWGDWRIVV